MSRIKFYWNLLRHSRNGAIKFESDGVMHEIEEGSKLWKPLNFLVYTEQLFLKLMYIAVIMIAALITLEIFLLTVVVMVFVVIVCMIVSPLFMIPKDFKEYLPTKGS